MKKTGRRAASALAMAVALAAGGLLLSASPASAKDYARNGRCDDDRYETSNGGKAAHGSDEYDCSRYGGGMKGDAAKQRARASGDNDKSLQKNGKCDDPIYNTTTGRAAVGADEFDCSRYGGGMKGKPADRASRAARDRDDDDDDWDDRDRRPSYRGNGYNNNYAPNNGYGYNGGNSYGYGNGYTNNDPRYRPPPPRQRDWNDDDDDRPWWRN